MKKGTRVSWLSASAAMEADGTPVIDDPASGVTISDEEDGHIQVAVDKATFDGVPASYRMVVYMSVAELTAEPDANSTISPASAAEFIGEVGNIL